jgi:FHA domain
VGVGEWLNRVQPKFFRFLHGQPRAETATPPAAHAPPATTPAPAPAPAQVQAPPPPPAQPEAPVPAPPPAPSEAPVAAPPPAQPEAPATPAVEQPTPEARPVQPTMAAGALPALAQTVVTLVGQDGGLAGRSVTIDSAVTLGRETADIVIEDPEVSRRHASLDWNQGRPELSDLGSANGTFVNGERIDAPRELHDGDVVKLGRTTFAIELPPPRDPGATVISPR